MSFEVQNKNLLISDNPSLLDIAVVHDFLTSRSYWAEGIPREIVEKAMANSLCFGLYEHGNQIGFARLVTDKATFAYLADVFVLEEYRGKGLSKWLIEVIQSHPDVQGLRRWMLMTRDAQGLYEKFGWTVLDEDARLRSMQRHFKEVYKRG